jgi:hypothetical protein
VLFAESLNLRNHYFNPQVEKRRNEALSKAKIEDGSSSALENNLFDVVSRYSFQDLWPCSSKNLEHFSRQEVYLLPIYNQSL